MLGGYAGFSRTAPFKDIQDILFYLLILSGIFILVTLWLYGAVWMAEKLYPSLLNLAQVTLALVLCLLLPMAFFKKTRLWSGFGMVVASYIIGLSLWVLQRRKSLRRQACGSSHARQRSQESIPSATAVRRRDRQGARR